MLSRGWSLTSQMAAVLEKVIKLPPDSQGTKIPEGSAWTQKNMRVIFIHVFVFSLATVWVCEEMRIVDQFKE